MQRCRKAIGFYPVGLRCGTTTWGVPRQEGASQRFSAGELLLTQLPSKLGRLLLHCEEQHFKKVSEVNLCRKTHCTESLFLSSALQPKATSVQA